MALKPKKERARPISYTPAIGDEIVRRLSDGEPLRQICRDEHMPSWSAIYRWMAQDSELESRIARARDLGTEAIAEETIHIIDEEPRLIESEGGVRIDPGFVAWQKARVEQRLKLLAKWNPKKFGDRIQQDVHHTGLSEVLASITGASLKPVRDEPEGD